MKTKKILSHLGINHTGKQQMGNSTNYLSSDIPPNSHNNAKQGQKRVRFKHQISLLLERIDINAKLIQK